MKLRLLALLLALAMLLCGCSGNESGKNRKDDDDDDRRTEHRKDDEDEEEDDEGDEHPGGMDGLDSWGDDQHEDVPDDSGDTQDTPDYRVVEVLFKSTFGGEGEYGVITGLDANGEEVWSVSTAVYPPTQLIQVTGIGLWNDRYYYVEGEEVVALERDTGRILWINEDFRGNPANGDRACMILEDGTLYLTGYFGPDFMAIDKDGHSLIRIGTVHEDYYWPYDLNLEGNLLTITMEGGPEGSWEYFVTLDTETWEVVE